MIDVLERTEAIPASYPAVTTYAHLEQYTGDMFPTLDPDEIWQRIEAYTAFRWSEREVTWIIEGSGQWKPDLTPATVTATEVWFADAWAPVELTPSAVGGYVFAGDGPYRITATVGGGTVPKAVEEAWRRLHEYSRGVADAYLGSQALRSRGDSETITGWAGKALQLSGAADLLRPYRRAP
ncbi:hypothetical protein [Tropicimonas sediminicola]|uniref:Uncharacterized protein n=1 Tax=Tropicimonas sediminicola TaxID=1031541 RepID=A0A239M4Q5_9RHOB|nr:hypothetical protein [Tropicimonas sediminicola]SNT37601.1 hypothetical protein SAMN05421757_11328 [Tropicimonas sediminicola]